MTGYCSKCGNQICICDEIEAAKKAKPNNPPAFPSTPVRKSDGILDPDFYHGMTLRDYFAAAALRGMLADPGAPPFPSNHDEWAKAAYRHADAMLKVRSA